MGYLSTLLGCGLGLLMVDALIEMGFIASTVRFLNTGADGPYTVSYQGSTFDLSGKPANLLVNQGHTSNGAAGTALILIGLGGFLALYLRSRPAYATSRLSVFWYRAWLALSVLAALLTLDALIYVCVVTAAHAGQAVDPALAASLAAGAAYPELTWTPQNWYAAVLALPLADPAQVSAITTQYHVMEGWAINIRLLFIIQFVVMGLSFADMWQRQSWRPVPVSGDEKGQRADEMA